MPYIKGYVKFEMSEPNNSIRISIFTRELRSVVESTLNQTVEVDLVMELVRDGRSVLSELTSDLFRGDGSYDLIAAITSCVMNTTHLPNGTPFNLFAPFESHMLGRVTVGGVWDSDHRNSYDLTKTRLSEPEEARNV